MATVGTLAVNVMARTKPFESGMNRARGSTKRFGTGITRNLGVLKRWGASLLAVAGVGGLGFLIRQSLSAGDALAKVSDKLGIATENLAGLRLAAELTGVQTNALDTGIQRMVRRLAEAAQGTGEARGAIAELGLDAQKLSQMAPDQAFSAIADAMRNVSSQSDRVRLAFKLFDTEGVALVNTLKLGSAGLAEIQLEAERLGIAFNRIELGQIEAANDSVLRLQKQFKALGTVVAIKVAPAIVALTGAVGRLIGWMKNLDSGTITQIKNWAKFAIGIGIAIKLTPVILKAFQLIVKGFRAMAAGQSVVLALGGPAGWAQLAIGAAVAAAAVFAVGEAFDGISDAMKTSDAASKQMAADRIDALKFTGGGPSAPDPAEAAQKWGASQDEVASALKRSTTAQRGLNAAVRDQKTPNVGAILRGTSAGASLIAESVIANQENKESERITAELQNMGGQLEELLDEIRGDGIGSPIEVVENSI